MNIAIIVAGGKGKRMRRRVNKLFLLLNKNPIIYHTLKIFNDCKKIDKIILVINPDDQKEFKSIVKAGKFSKVEKIVEGGKERQDSTYNGIKAIEKADKEDVILIHNAANPFIDEALIEEMIKATKKFGAAVCGFPAKDTIKVVEEGLVKQTIDRKLLWQAQTPQAMKYFLAKKAFEIANRDGFYGTDDVSLVEKMHGQVKMVYCSRENFKITDQHDLAYANKLSNASKLGIGTDSHKFLKKKALVLGGVEITKEYGFDANSDGDVILHSLFNAISTSIGMKSLGYYADKMFEEGITDSKEYLKFILEKTEKKNLKIGNVAIMLEGKKPKIDGHIDKIKKKLSKLLKVKEENIGIAATTGEELTEFGKGKGMYCVCAVTLKN
ncbi:2-C-methyl-D-erythritol 4-phosphate cytidylyltransferase [Candidatus Woesearchaeota archaeon]|nr:2-C-methyl-D-erythritol 4-phosphate cytidylyltransferase [Candidatus Woesearchaeota archaeon]